MMKFIESEEDEEKRQEFYQKIDGKFIELFTVLSLPLPLPFLSVDMYEACKVGDLSKIKLLMPDVQVALNDCKKEHMTLLMT